MLPFRMWMIVSKLLKRTKCYTIWIIQTLLLLLKCLRYRQFIVSIFLHKRMRGWCRGGFCIGIFWDGRQQTQIWRVLTNRDSSTTKTFNLVHYLNSVTKWRHVWFTLSITALPPILKWFVVFDEVLGFAVSPMIRYWLHLCFHRSWFGRSDNHSCFEL